MQELLDMVRRKQKLAQELLDWHRGQGYQKGASRAQTDLDKYTRWVNVLTEAITKLDGIEAKHER